MASYMHNQRVNLTQTSKIPSSTSSSSLSTYSNKNNNVMNKPSWFFIFLLFSISVLTFFLQWRGGYIDQVNQLPFFVPPDGSSDCASMNSTQSSSPVSPDFKSLKFISDLNVTTKICITSTTAASLEEVLPWIFYHKVVGISNFFLFVEGKAASPNVTKVLERIPGVKVIPRTRELEEQQAQSRIWNETWLADAFHKPCNAALFVKQNLNMEMAIVMARDSGMEWILHVDTDELLHPAGTRNYSVSELLTKVPSDVDAVVFSNYESAVESDDIKEPFTEASMFKKNFEHLPTDSNFELYKIATRGNPNYFLTYSNGKSAARVQDHLRPNGAHRWYNYFKEPKEIKLEDAAILHYTYSRFSDLTSRRDRCNCKPTQEDVKRCFWLEFDRIAFIIASTETQDRMLQWYRDHVVWDNEKMNLKLLKYGVFTRIYTPMVIIQKLRESGVFDSVITSAQAASH